MLTTICDCSFVMFVDVETGEISGGGKRRRVADGPDGDGDFGAAVEMTAAHAVTKIATAIPRRDDE